MDTKKIAIGLACIVPNSNPLLHHEGIANETIIKFKNMFDTQEKYEYYLKTLIAMRKLIHSQIIYDGANIDTTHEYFPIFKTLNELIGVLI